MSDSVLALIPARGGSKGILRKNLLPLLGRPMIAYSILQAKASRHISRVIVSTDDPEIAEVSRQWGAEVPFMRPPEFAQDSSPDIDVFRHALTWLGEHEGRLPGLVVHLRPPGPVRRVELIDAAIGLLVGNPDADAVRSVQPALQTPFKMWRISDSELLEPLLTVPDLDDCQSMPRQRLPMVYWQNGYIDVLRPRAVLENNRMWGNRAIPFIVEEPVFELDYPEDVPKVEEALRLMECNELHTVVPSRRHPV